MSYTVTRYHDFCAGHRVVGHESKCRYLHGHNYRAHFTVEPKYDLDDIGRVVDFSVIKSSLCEWLENYWDHRMLIWDQDPLLQLLHQATDTAIVKFGEQIQSTIVPVPFNPTAENMAQHLVEIVGPYLLPVEVELVKCRIEETRKCSATYER